MKQMVTMAASVTLLDTLARRIAEQAGVRWDDLSDYPGYSRNIWRDQARTLIASIAPDAVFQEAPRTIWEGGKS